MLKKIYFDYVYMNLAIDQSIIAYKKNEIPIGATLVYKKKIIIKGYNKTIVNNNPMDHAELLVLKKAAKILTKIQLGESALYSSLEPCPMCSHAINLFKIRKLTFGAYNIKGGAIDHGPRILQLSNSYKNIITVGGLLEVKCEKFLKNYFKKIRII
jgi:tRNA(adenine34) deaminase